MNKTILTLLKIIISIGALWFVFTKVNFSDILEIYQNAHIGWLSLGLLGYLISRIMGAYRLNYFLRDVKVSLSEINNFKLYILGMYYSLFLPGSIGGDGYKVYWLKQRFDIKVKSLISALLFDRLMGMMVIGLLLTVLYFQLGLPYGWLGLIGSAIGLGVAYAILKHWIKAFTAVFVPTLLLSISFHIIQIASIFCILHSLGITTSYFEYGFIFLISSIASAIPFTVGGAGARELTFLYGATYLGLQEPIAIAVSLMFYLFSLIVSLSGAYFSFFPETIQHEPLPQTS